MRSLLIVYHSMTGGTRQMAQAAADEANAQAGDAVEVRLLHAGAASAADVLSADAYLFASPENLAAMSGVMKDFFDRSYYDVLDRIAGRRYGVMVCAGSDGQNAVRQIERIATGWRLVLAAPSMIVCTRAQTTEQILAPKSIPPDDLQRCADLGAGLAQGLALGIF